MNYFHRVYTMILSGLLTFIFLTRPLHARDEFETRFELALDQVRSVLSDAKSASSFVIADPNIPHEYEDKYLLNEFVVNSAIAITLQTLEVFGLSFADLHKISKSGKPASLLFSIQTTCDLKNEKEAEIESLTNTKISDVVVLETHTVNVDGTSSAQKETQTKSSSKIIRKIMEYTYKFTVDYSLNMIGVDHKPYPIANNKFSNDLIVKGRNDPPCTSFQNNNNDRVKKNASLDLTFLFEHVDFDEDNTMIVPTFSIDRNDEFCRTPNNNQQMNNARDFFKALSNWSIINVFDNFIHKVIPKTEVGWQNQLQRMFWSFGQNDAVPILPLFVTHTKGKETSKEDGLELLTTTSKATILSQSDLNLLLKHQKQRLKNRLDSYSRSVDKMVYLFGYLRHIGLLQELATEHVQSMIFEQLVTSLGKVIGPADFDEFLKEHGKRIFQIEFQPKFFIHAVRRPNHAPEGAISIETKYQDKHDPIITVSRMIESDDIPLRMSLDAGTIIEAKCNRYLHAWVRHDFADSHATSRLVARARQFSSFLLVTGTMAGVDDFEPKNAIILQSKDELIIPLLLEQLPTPKSFRDSIASLSEEQKSFAKSFRSMQLQSTVLGILIIQIKPQLEAVLNLPDQSLTKEIQLTQDLLSMFIDYQIPSDLLSYDATIDASPSEKIKAVQTHVNSVKKMISDAKKQELSEKKMQAELNKAEKIHPDRMHTFQATAVPLGVDSFVMAETISSDETASFSSESIGHRRLREKKTPLDDKITYQNENLEKEGEKRLDFSRIPNKLDSNLEFLDTYDALRSTKVSIGHEWIRKCQRTLSSKPKKKIVSKEEQEEERRKAFDLLDALTKSGDLPINYAEIHVLVSVTHRFDKSLVATVVEDSQNPIEKLEQSMLLTAATIHHTPLTKIAHSDKLKDLEKNSPNLFNISINEISRKND